jgi:hypothetical protein
VASYVFSLTVAELPLILHTAWGDDDDEDKPEPRKSADELAHAVVHFEREMARASLDLYVAFIDIMNQW